MTDRYRHKVRGSTYRVLYEAAKASSIIAALDDMTMVVYQCEQDGLVWVRPALEFFDGRFQRLGSVECVSCAGRGFVVHDSEWEPYAAQCPTCSVPSQDRGAKT